MRHPRVSAFAVLGVLVSTAAASQSVSAPAVASPGLVELGSSPLLDGGPAVAPPESAAVSVASTAWLAYDRALSAGGFSEVSRSPLRVTHAFFVDGVRVLGASVSAPLDRARVLAGHPEGSVPSLAAQDVWARLSWPPAVDAASAGAAVAARLAADSGVTAETVDGRPVRFWVPVGGSSLDVPELVPAMSFFAGDRLLRVDARTGHILTDLPAVIYEQGAAGLAESVFPGELINGIAPGDPSRDTERWLARGPDGGQYLRVLRARARRGREGLLVDSGAAARFPDWDRGWHAVIDGRNVSANPVQRCLFADAFMFGGFLPPPLRPVVSSQYLGRFRESFPDSRMVNLSGKADQAAADAHVFLRHARRFVDDVPDVEWNGLYGESEPVPVLVNFVSVSDGIVAGCFTARALYSNAFFFTGPSVWNGGTLAFGQLAGSEKMLASSPSIVAHEFAHAVQFGAYRRVHGTFGMQHGRYIVTLPGRSEVFIVDLAESMACGRRIGRGLGPVLQQLAGVASPVPPALFPLCRSFTDAHITVATDLPATEVFADVVALGVEHQLARVRPNRYADFGLGDDVSVNGAPFRSFESPYPPFAGGTIFDGPAFVVLATQPYASTALCLWVSLDIALLFEPPSYGVYCVLSPVAIVSRSTGSARLMAIPSPHGPGQILGHVVYRGVQEAGGNGYASLQRLVDAFVRVAVNDPAERSDMLFFARRVVEDLYAWPAPAGLADAFCTAASQAGFFSGESCR